MSISKNSKLQQLESFIKETPNDPFLVYAIGLEYQKINDLDKTRQYFNQLVENFPDYLGVYYRYAALEVELNNIDKAKTLYKKGIEVAKSQNNHKTLAELKGALMNLEIMED